MHRLALPVDAKDRAEKAPVAEPEAAEEQAGDGRESGGQAAGTETAQPVDGAPRTLPRTGSDDFYLGSTRKQVAGAQLLPADSTSGELVAMLTLEGAALPAAKDSPRARRGAAPGASDAATERPELDESAKVGALAAFLVEQVRQDAPPPEVRRVAGLRVQAVATGPAAANESRAPEDAGVVQRDWLVEGSAEDVALLLRELGRFAGQSGRSLRASEARLAVPGTQPADQAADRDTAEDDRGAAQKSRKVAGAAGESEAKAPTSRRLVLRFRLRSE